MTNQILRLPTLLAITAFIAVGCGKSGFNASAVNADTILDTTSLASTSDYYGNGDGGSAVFVPDSMSAMSSYVSTHPLNDPTNFRLYVETYDQGGGRYGGGPHRLLRQQPTLPRDLFDRESDRPWLGSHFI